MPITREMVPNFLLSNDYFQRNFSECEVVGMNAEINEGDDN